MTLGAIVATIAIIVVTILAGIWIDRRRPILPRPQDLAKDDKLLPPPAYGAGEAPSTAIRTREAQLQALRSTQRCATDRAAMTNDPAADDRIRYDERDLLVLHFTCTRCGAKRSMYVEPVPS